MSNTGRSASSATIARRAISSTAASSARFAGPRPREARKLGGAGVHQAAQAAQAAEVGQQPLRELQHAGAQQQGEQLGVGERLRAASEQLLARAGLGRQLLDRHRGAGTLASYNASL